MERDTKYITDRVEYWRENGHWYMCVHGPEWVLDEIARDMMPGNYPLIANYDGGPDHGYSILFNLTPRKEA